jgi:hypothetical protein
MVSEQEPTQPDEQLSRFSEEISRMSDKEIGELFRGMILDMVEAFTSIGPIKTLELFKDRYSNLADHFRDKGMDSASDRFRRVSDNFGQLAEEYREKGMPRKAEQETLEGSQN